MGRTVQLSGRAAFDLVCAGDARLRLHENGLGAGSSARAGGLIAGGNDGVSMFCTHFACDENDGT